ncbi:MAG: hypothetical protein WKF97_21955 [Chitinophagaceae bacterium]
MNYTQKNYLLFCLILVGVNVHAQDKIYFTKKKTNDWKVTEITANAIKGTDAVNPKVPYSTTHSDVLFVFNSIGNFLVIPGLYENAIKADVYSKNFFLQADPDFNKVDKIITEKNDIITGMFRMEKENTVEYTVGNKFLTIPKKDVTVIIFKDGKHKLISSADKAYRTLKSIQDNYYQLAFSTKMNQGTEVRKDTQAIAGSPVVEPKKDTVSQPMSQQSVSNNRDSSVSKPAAKQRVAGKDAPAPKTVSNTNYSGTKTAASTGARGGGGKTSASEARLDSATITGLQKKALLNIKELEGYIRLISDKDTDADQLSKTIDQAVSLFINEDATVEVSSINRSDVQQYKVGVYLKRLGLLKYDKVVIEWYDVQYTSRLRKGPDGNYYGFIEFEQRFTGISGDNKTYEDITRKTVEIVLKTYEKRRGGETSLEWDVFLGNIGIAVTKPS